MFFCSKAFSSSSHETELHIRVRVYKNIIFKRQITIELDACGRSENRSRCLYFHNKTTEHLNFISVGFYFLHKIKQFVKRNVSEKLFPTAFCLLMKYIQWPLHILLKNIISAYLLSKILENSTWRASNILKLNFINNLFYSVLEFMEKFLITWIERCHPPPHKSSEYDDLPVYH